MKALILAGGYGTRLYPIVKDKAKALLEIQGRPIIDYLLDKLKSLGDLRGIYVVTNEKFYKDFADWADEHKAYPCPIDVVNDRTKTNEERLGSIGDMNFVLKEKPTQEDLLVLGGDNLFDFRIEDFVRESQKNRPGATIGLFDIKEKQRATIFGVVSLDEKKKVVLFEEKPQSPKSSLIAMCLYYFPKETLSLIDRYIHEGHKADAAGGYIKWLAQAKDVYGFIFDGRWYDIGSVESYQDAQKNFKPQTIKKGR